MLPDFVPYLLVHCLLTIQFVNSDKQIKVIIILFIIYLFIYLKSPLSH